MKVLVDMNLSPVWRETAGYVPQFYCSPTVTRSGD